MKSQEFIAQALLEWLSNALATAPDVHRAGLPIMDVEYFLARLAQVAGFEPGQFSLALVGFGGSATDLEHLAAKYGLASLRGLSDDLYAAARWRNHRLAHGRILAFCAGRHPGVHTLQHFTRAGSRELAQALLKWARDQGDFPVSEPQRLLLHELATNQELMPLLSLEAAAEFLAAWQRCGEHDPADAPRRALPALGLYADPQLFSAQKTLQRLLANLGLSQKLRELPGSKLREKRRQIEKYRDQATRERLLDVLARLEAQRLGNAADIPLTLDEVSQLISLPRDTIDEPEEQGSVEGPEIRDESDLDRRRLKAQCTNALLDNRHETLQAAAGALEEAWQEYVPGEGAELHGEFESEGEAYTFSLSIDTGLLNWLETFCAPEVWGGWLETQEPSLDTALNNYREAEPILLDPERIVTLNGRKLSMQELLAAWDQGLSEEHLGNPGLSPLWAQFSALRSKLAGSVRLLLYNPLEWLAGRPEVAAEVTRFLDLASALYQGVQTHFRVMAGISEGYARSVLEGLLALDILQVRVRLAAGAFAHKAVMLPTHPLHLWRHQRLTQILRGLGDKLDPEDRKAIIEDTQRPEHFLSVIGLGSIPDGKGAAQVLPVSGEIQGMATFENLINAYGGADGKETLSYAIDRYASLARHHARPLRLGVINPPEPNRLLAECVRLLNSPRFRQPATLPRLRVEFFATPTHTGRIKSALRFGDEVRDLVEEKLASGRLELALHEDTLELAERVKQLSRNPFHILAVFDEASIRMRRRGAGKGLPMSPFCIRHKIQVERFEDIMRLIPDSNEPPFSEFMQLVNEAESGQRDSTPHAWADAEGLRRTVDELLQGASPAAQWVLLADRALPTETGMASVRLLQRRNGQRQVLLATRDYRRIAQLLRPAFDRFNVVLSPQEMEGLLYEGVNLIGAGLLDLIQSKDGRADPKRVLGLAGLLFAARDYQRRHPQGLIVSVDNEMARLWLRMGSGKGRERSDLLGLDRTGDGFVIDCIEVKTTASDNLSDTDARMEHAVAQVRATLDALAEALPRDESGSGPLSAPRSEMLKEVLVRACQARNISPERRRQWGQWLKQLFRQEADEDSVEIGLRGEVVKVLLADNRRATESEWEAEPYPITVRSVGEGEVQDLIAWRPDPLSSEPCSRPVTPGAHTARELPAQPIPAGAMAPQLSAPAVLASPVAPTVIVPDARPQPGTPSDAPWPPPVNTLGMIGQTRAVQQLVDQARFARGLGERFADKLLVGPAGVGKSSLARAIARLLLDEPEILFNGSDLRRPELLIDRLRQEGRIADDSSQPRAIARCLLFIDEVHAIGAATATALLSAMDDQRLTTMEGVTYSFGDVVFILATTDPGRLSEAFNSRPDKTWLRPYTLDELAGIIWLHGRECLDGFELAREVCLEIAARMRANPRRAVRSLREALRPYFFRMRSGTGTGSPGLADIGRAMTLDAVGVYYDEQGIDSNGLDNTSRSFLQYLLRNGATAEPRLKQGLGITNPGDFIEVDEYLHRLGLIEITAGGRALTRLGRRYLDQPLSLRERISRQLD